MAAHWVMASSVSSRKSRALRGRRSICTAAIVKSSSRGTASTSPSGTRQSARSSPWLMFGWRAATHDRHAAFSLSSPIGRVRHSFESGAYEGSLMRSQWIQETFANRFASAFTIVSCPAIERRSRYAFVPSNDGGRNAKRLKHTTMSCFAAVCTNASSAESTFGSTSPRGAARDHAVQSPVRTKLIPRFFISAKSTSHASGFGSKRKWRWTSEAM